MNRPAREKQRCGRCETVKPAVDFNTYPVGDGTRRLRGTCKACAADMKRAARSRRTGRPPRLLYKQGDPDRVCRDCRQTKPVAEFPHYTERRTGRRKMRPCCKPCWSKDVARRAGKHTEPARPVAPGLPTAEQLAAWHRNGCRLSSRSAA